MKVSTHKQRNTLMKHVLEANGNKMAAAIQKQHILDGLGRRAQNPSAARHFLTTMRRMCVWAVAQKILPVDPTEGIKAPKPAAGLTNQSAHGLRKAAANVAAKNGATEAELDAIFGWTDRRMASHYTKAANRKKLAHRGVAKLERMSGSMDHRANVYSLTDRLGARNRAKNSVQSDGHPEDGGHDRDRTCDPYHVKVVLSR
jgi:hypothetical protein